MRGRTLIVAVSALALAGCANMFSIHRTDDVTPDRTSNPLIAPGAKIVLIDAKQRAITSVSRPSDTRPGGASTTARTIVCAEPSPDALQAIAASNAFSVRDERDREAKIAQVIQESAASIGLRTQSIQLLRDAMFRICEAYQAHALSDDEVMALHRRYQNLMLGLLAIEQLTGVTKAGQVALINAGSASAGAATSDLAAAEKRVADERKGLAEAEEQLANRRNEAAATAATIAEKTDARDDEEDTKKKGALQAEIQKLTAQKQAQDAAALSASKKVEIQADLVKSASEAVTSARGRVSAAAEGSAKIFDGVSVRGVMDAQTSAAIATATHSIVKEVVNGSFLYEACFSHLDRLIKVDTPTPVQSAILTELLETCFSGVRSRLQATGPASTNGVAAPAGGQQPAPAPAPANAGPAGSQAPGARSSVPEPTSIPKTRDALRQQQLR